MTICPGKQGDSDFGASWQRDMAADLEAIRQWGAKAIVTAMEPEEMQRLNVTELGTSIQAMGLEWYQLPITDGQPPDARFEERWPEVMPWLLQHLNRGDAILIHCRGGLGRTGTIVSLLLVELGMGPGEAIMKVREARPGTVETIQQQSYVRNYKCLTRAS